MIHEDYKQLTAYARYDGIYLAIIWAASFACLLGIEALPVLAQFSFLLILSTPFFVAYRLKIFREEGRKGVISFRRSLFYCLRVFFNAAIIFSFLQWLYMRFLDNGKLLIMFSNIYSVHGDITRCFTTLFYSFQHFYHGSFVWSNLFVIDSWCHV